MTVFKDSGFKRTLCGSTWESLKGDKNAFTSLGTNLNREVIIHDPTYASGMHSASATEQSDAIGSGRCGRGRLSDPVSAWCAPSGALGSSYWEIKTSANGILRTVVGVLSKGRAENCGHSNCRLQYLAVMKIKYLDVSNAWKWVDGGKQFRRGQTKRDQWDTVMQNDFSIPVQAKAIRFYTVGTSKSTDTWSEHPSGRFALRIDGRVWNTQMNNVSDCQAHCSNDIACTGFDVSSTGCNFMVAAITGTHINTAVLAECFRKRSGSGHSWNKVDGGPIFQGLFEIEKLYSFENEKDVVEKVDTSQPTQTMITVQNVLTSTSLLPHVVDVESCSSFGCSIESSISMSATTLPEPPKKVEVSADTADSLQVKITPPDDDGSADITHYKLAVRRKTPFAYTQIGSTVVLDREN